MRWLLTLCQSVCSGLSPFPILHVYLDNRQTNWLSDPSCNKCCYRVFSATCSQCTSCRCFNHLHWQLREIYNSITLTFAHSSIVTQRIVLYPFYWAVSTAVNSSSVASTCQYFVNWFLENIYITFILGDIQIKFIQENTRLLTRESRVKTINGGIFLWKLKVSCFWDDPFGHTSACRVKPSHIMFTLCYTAVIESVTWFDVSNLLTKFYMIVAVKQLVSPLKNVCH